MHFETGVVHGVAGAFTLGVLFNVGPRIGKYTREGMTRVFRPHNLHITALGLMLIFTGFYAFYGACLVIASTSFPGWATIYLSPTTLGSITMVITLGFAGGFTGGYFASRGDPFWTISGGLAGVIGVSAGADVYAPTLAWLIAMLTAVLVVYAGRLAASGDFRSIRRLMTDRPHRFTIRSSDDRALAAALMDDPAVFGAELVDGLLAVRTSDYGAFTRIVAPTARTAGVRLHEVKPTDDSLESVFGYLVRR